MSSLFRSVGKALGFGEKKETDEVSIKFCVGDTVQFQTPNGESHQGLIKFIGGVYDLGPTEKWIAHYGIECELPIPGGHDGKVSKVIGRQLFPCRKGCGVLVLRDQIQRIIKPSEIDVRIAINDVIKHTHLGFGVIKFIGSVTGTEGVWFGIELFDQKGSHDGCFKDEVYFDCENSFGNLCRMRAVRLAEVKELESPSIVAGLAKIRMLQFDGESGAIDLRMEGEDEKGELEEEEGEFDGKKKEPTVTHSLSEGKTDEVRRFKDFYDCDIVSDHLGDGSFGSVFKCYSKILKIGKRRRKYAMKRISKVTIMKMDDAATKDELLMGIRDEIRHLRKMRREKGKLLPGYRNVMHFVDAFEEPGFLYIITNFCNGSTLYDYCLSHDSGLTEKQCQKVIKHVLLGLRFMKNYDIAHLDLNPSNIMLVKHPKTGEKMFQIVDFGMARVIPRMRKVAGHTVGTPHFIAPEVLNGEYNPLSDVWSLGVILFLLLFGYPPFFDSDPRGNDAVIFRMIKKGFDTESWLNRKPGQGAWIPSDYRVHRSDQVCELVCRCLDLDLAKRIAVDDALDDQWINTEVTDKELPHGMHNALLTFTKQCKFRLLMSRMFTAELTADEWKKVRDVFKALDADGNGKVSREEFIQGMTEFKLGYDAESLGEMFEAVDINNDGNLDLSELMTAFSYQRMAATDARLEAIFKELVDEGTGFVTRDALAEKWEDLKDKRRAERMKLESGDSKLSESDIAADRRVDELIWGRESTVARMSDIELAKLDAELDERITNAIAYADLDGDGKISKDEFMASMHPELHESSTLSRDHRPRRYSEEYSFARVFQPSMTASMTAASGGTHTLGAGDYSDEDDYYDDEFDLGETSSEEESESEFE